jgi:glycosyltransferase involved in cell wall biosynthesis
MVVGAPRIVVVAIDNHVRKTFPGEYDYLFGAHSWGDGHDAVNFHWLPCAYDPEENYDMGLTRDVDVTLIGCYYQHRLDAMTFLLSKGITVAMAWGRVNPEWNELYNHSRVALCPSYAKDASDRILEGMAQGCLVIVDRGIPDLDKMGFREQFHYLAYGDHGELAECVKQARDERFRSVIVKQAKEAIRRHTWQDRVRELVKVVEG